MDAFTPGDSVFAKYQEKSWPYRFHGSLHIGCLMAGTPADPNKAQAWLQTRMLDNPKDDDSLLQRAVAETMAELGITKDEAIAKVNELRNLLAFKQDSHGLYIEGRQLKAALKEAVSVAVAADKIPQKGYGETNKFATKYVPEHVFVAEDRLYLGVTEPTGVEQQFIHSRFGSSIQYNQYVLDAKVDFTIDTDYDFAKNAAEWWAMVWTTGEKQGIGSCRSQGYGTYAVTRWEPAVAAPKKRAARKS